MSESNAPKSTTGLSSKWRELSPKAKLWTKIAGSSVAGIVAIALVFNWGYEAAKADVRKAITEAFGGSGTSSSSSSSTASSSSQKSSASTVGTRQNPAPLGTKVVMSDNTGDLYEVTLSEPTLNANSIIAKTNRYNKTAPEGQQFAMVKIDVVYIGTETGKPSSDIDVTFVTKAGTTHTEGDVSVVSPAEFYNINELYKGGAGSAYIAIAVPSADIESGNWVVSAGYGEKKYFYKAQ